MISATTVEEGQVAEEIDVSTLTKKDRQATVKKLQKQMLEASDRLDFELAAQLRDMMMEIKALD
ncbi:Excinuclease ABC subunit B [Streptococcus sp. DD12]|nr:Excinuclease ABC subunit B [Streptococcus sp. DD12]